MKRVFLNFENSQSCPVIKFTNMSKEVFTTDLVPKFQLVFFLLIPNSILHKFSINPKCLHTVLCSFPLIKPVLLSCIFRSPCPLYWPLCGSLFWCPSCCSYYFFLSNLIHCSFLFEIFQYQNSTSFVSCSFLF